MKHVLLSEIVEEVIQIAHTQVWASVATVDSLNRPWTRVLHPIWEVQNGQLTGWVLTNRHSLKEKHLAFSPYASVGYVKDPFNPLTIECHAAWQDDFAERERIWEWFKREPQPLGYDPALVWKEGPGNESVGLLKLTPWRLTLGHLGGEWRAWHS